MARQHRGTEQDFSSAGIGQWIGEAIGEGLAQGTQQALTELGAELAPFVGEIVAALRRDLTESFKQLDEVAEEHQAASYGHPAASAAYGMKCCKDPGCTEPALARNLCRRHYARKLYQERKGRQGTVRAAAAPRRRPVVLEGEDTVVERKLAPVAPIIRRKKSEAVAAPVLVPDVAPTPLPAPAAISAPVTTNVIPIAPPAMSPPPQAPSVTVESVARFFGLKG